MPIYLPIDLIVGIDVLHNFVFFMLQPLGVAPLIIVMDASKLVK